MNILIISGFLGAGKTTFIKELAKRTHREIAIFENEYGAVDVDGSVLKASSETEKVNIWELAEGCICCSVKGDFAASVLTIANTVDPDCLVIEPTGVGMLGNILNNLKTITYERIHLLAPLTVVDGLSFEKYTFEYPKLFRNQIEFAHRIVISKMEQSSDEEINKVESILKEWNPKAEILKEHYSNKDDIWWEELFNTGLDGNLLIPLKSEEEKLPDSFSMGSAFFNKPEELFLFLEDLIRGCFGEIIRAKGCLPAGDIWLRFDVADGRYSVIGAGESLNEGKAVFIGSRIDRQAIRKRVFCQNIHLIKTARDNNNKRENWIKNFSDL